MSPNSSFFQQLLEEQNNFARKLKEVKEQLEIPAKFGYGFSGFSVEQLIFPEKNVLRTAFSQNSSRWLPLIMNSKNKDLRATKQYEIYFNVKIIY